MIKLEIVVDGVIRNFSGDYDELSGKDWNGIVQDMLDDAHAFESDLPELDEEII